MVELVPFVVLAGLVVFVVVVLVVVVFVAGLVVLVVVFVVFVLYRFLRIFEAVLFGGGGKVTGKSLLVLFRTMLDMFILSRRPL